MKGVGGGSRGGRVQIDPLPEKTTLIKPSLIRVKGFIQYFSMQPYILGLWTEKNIDMFHYNAKQYTLICYGRRYRKYCC